MELSPTIRTVSSRFCATNGVEFSVSSVFEPIRTSGKNFNTEGTEEAKARTCRRHRAERKSAANCETVSCSARTSGDRPASRKTSSARTPSRLRRLLRNVFLL